MRSFFQKFKVGLQKTTPTFYKAFSRIGDTLSGRALDEEALEELEEALYGADFGVETTEEILEEIQRSARKDKSLRGQDAAKIGAGVLARVLEGAEARMDISHQPEVIALIGVNGSGKTTTAAKLAHRLREDGHSVLLGACDTFRAAANEQIRSWADTLNLELIASQHGADAAAVAYDAWQAARARSFHTLILDTAGRLHTKSNLMEELAKIRRVLGKHDASAPHHRLLVLDGSIGSNSIEQARVFHRDFGVSGLIVTKLDGTSRGGALVGIYRELGLPIYFVGLGEKAEDLQPFSIENYTSAIFGLEEES